MGRTLRLSLRACRLLTQTTAFAHLLGGLGPRAFGPVVELESPFPSSLGACCLQLSLHAGIPAPLARSHTIVICKENNMNPPPQEVPHKNSHQRKTSQKFQTIVLIKIPTYWKMVSYPLIKEGQLSHKYAIASSVEPMNLLSKGSNESLPKY